MKDADAAELYRKLTVHPGSKISLEDFDPRYKPDSLNKDEAQTLLEDRNRELAELQAMLYAQNTYALLIIFQALDAAGKDGTIKHVMSGVNPQGCQVYSFKAPSAEELDHDYLWRAFKALPERGRIGIFNRSYYEEVLVVRVHPEILAGQQLPAEARRDTWKRRFEEINNFEKYLVANGVMVLKFFLNVSKEEQKKRFLERIDESDKNWKFSVTDVKERGYWDAYMKVYEDAFNHTSTDWAPWHVIPADRKWFTWLAVSELILRKLKELDLEYPAATEDHRMELLRAKEMLDDEK